MATLESYQKSFCMFLSIRSLIYVLISYTRDVNSKARTYISPNHPSYSSFCFVLLNSSYRPPTFRAARSDSRLPKIVIFNYYLAGPGSLGNSRPSKNNILSGRRYKQDRPGPHLPTFNSDWTLLAVLQTTAKWRQSGWWWVAGELKKEKGKKGNEWTERRRAFVSAEIARPLAILRYYVHRFLPPVYSRGASGHLGIWDWVWGLYLRDRLIWYVVSTVLCWHTINIEHTRRTYNARFVIFPIKVFF